MQAKGLNMNIVLLTDFGYQDGFVGVMKGVIKSLSPHCNLIDLAHSVPDYDILRGALLLEAHYSYFPKGTIFLCVIDPGVGSDRQPIIVKSGGYYFVAPHNGILDLVTALQDIELCIEITNKAYMLESDSNSFHGRDIFAPVAAHLANGISMENMGEEIQYDWYLNYPFSSYNEEEKTVTGEILSFDKYGNALTNLRARKEIKSGRVMEQDAKFCDYFLQGNERMPNLINGSFGRVEIFLPQKSAEDQLRLRKGDEVILYLK